MVNEVIQHTRPAPYALIQNGEISSPDQIDPRPEKQDLFIEDRSRIMVTTVDPDQAEEEACHIHASKQITVLDGYAEVELPDRCIKLYEGQSAHIPNGTTHKIFNFGKIPLKYVEIRTGPYVLDDDHLS